MASRSEAAGLRRLAGGGGSIRTADGMPCCRMGERSRKRGGRRGDVITGSTERMGGENPLGRRGHTQGREARPSVPLIIMAARFVSEGWLPAGLPALQSAWCLKRCSRMRSGPLLRSSRRRGGCRRGKPAGKDAHGGQSPPSPAQRGFPGRASASLWADFMS